MGASCVLPSVALLTGRSVRNKSILPTLFSTGTESDDTINPDFDTMDIVDISFLDCRDMNVDEYRGDNLSGADSDSNDVNL